AEPAAASGAAAPAAQQPGSEAADRAQASAVPPDASFTGLAAFATAGRDPGAGVGTSESTTGGASTEHRTEESD
ncbi:ATP-binding protein, partial [Streptomyces sp. STCH 565 A]|nr:ATP-binding protein [Streptomyces sp. STCH 565 A]